MSDAGINVPADMRIGPDQAAAIGAGWLRVVLLARVDLNPWIEQAHYLGLRVLGCIARESLEPADAPMAAPPPQRVSYGEYLERIRTATGIVTSSSPTPVGAMTYEDAAQLYANRYGFALDALAPGNEPDLADSPSSWWMTVPDLNHLIEACANAFPPTLPLIGPGLASGQPSYLESDGGVRLDLLRAIGLHPYGRRPDDGQSWAGLPGNFGTLQELLDAYARFEKPYVISEWGVTTTECSESLQAQYVDAMQRQLIDTESVQASMYFCHDSAMVFDFGLFRTDGSPKPAVSAYIASAEGSSGGGEPIMPDPDYGPWVGKIGTGLLDMMKADGTLPAQRSSTWLPLGVTPSDIEEAHGQNGTLYVYHLDGSGAYRFNPGA